MNEAELITAMESFWKLCPSRDRPGVRAMEDDTGNVHQRLTAAIAKHLAAVLSPTFDEVVAAALELPGKDARQGVRLTWWDDGSSNIAPAFVNEIPPRGKMITWFAGGRTGAELLAAIQAKLKPPEPTPLEALERLRGCQGTTKPEDGCKLFGIIRKALEGKENP